MCCDVPMRSRTFQSGLFSLQHMYERAVRVRWHSNAAIVVGYATLKYLTSPLKFTDQACSHGIVCRKRPRHYIQALEAPALWSAFV